MMLWTTSYLATSILCRPNYLKIRETGREIGDGHPPWINKKTTSPYALNASPLKRQYDNAIVKPIVSISKEAGASPSVLLFCRISNICRDQRVELGSFLKLRVCLAITQDDLTIAIQVKLPIRSEI
jgi:hypothetical protein